MELFEIIKSSLSIFLAVAAFFISISYTIFKIKNRSRMKPDFDVQLQINSNSLTSQNSVYGINKDDKHLDKIVLIEHPVHNRFNIIDENKAAATSTLNVYKNVNPPQRLIPHIDFKNNRTEKTNKLDPIFR